MEMGMFIKYIKFDDEKRIVIAVQEHVASHLADKEARKQLREMLTTVLKEDFIKLEVAKTSARITVAEGKEDACKVLIETEIAKALEFAMNFMSQMNQEKE